MDFQINFRVVDYGTRFQPAAGLRTDRKLTPELLYENEFAADVGSTCHGYQGSELMVFDHHFVRSDLVGGNHGSAGLAVLAEATAITRHAAALRERGCREFWIVSHRYPDFDACCSSYLLLRLLEDQTLASSAEHWDCPNWRNPAVPLPANVEPANRQRALLLLAIYSAHVDHCVPEHTPRESSLRCLFLAAALRQRFDASLPDARPFFRVVEDLVVSQSLDPRRDVVLDEHGPFAHEVRFVRHQQEVYERDLARAELRSVAIARSRVPFSTWSKTVRQESLWLAGRPGRVFDAIRTRQGGEPAADIIHGFEAVDGLLIVDPKCVFFKDWARLDTDHSPSGLGFRFMAVAYPGQIPGALVNSSSYFLSIDPEFAVPRQLHLYDLWTELQWREGPEAVRLPLNGASSGLTRDDVLARGEEPAHGLFDPWYDGNGYAGTILVTPNRGTQLAPGLDVTSDAVMRIVSQWASRSFYKPFDEAPRWHIGKQFRWRVGQSDIEVTPMPCRPDTLGRGSSGEKEARDPGWKTITFGRFDLEARTGADPTSSPVVARQVGEDLWGLIREPGTSGVPSDFVERHLLYSAGWVVVWNRRGIAMGVKEGHESLAERVVHDLENLSHVMAAIDECLPARDDGADPARLQLRLDRTREALERLVRISRSASESEGRIIRRFFEATDMAGIAEALDSLNNLYREELEQRRDGRLANVLAWGTALSLVLAWLQVDGARLIGGDPPGLVRGLFANASYVFAALVGAVFLFSYWCSGRLRGGRKRRLSRSAARRPAQQPGRSEEIAGPGSETGRPGPKA